MKYSNLGVLFANARKPKQASDHFRRAHELKPQNAQYIEYLFGTLSEQQRSAEASHALRRLIAVNPKHPLANSK